MKLKICIAGPKSVGKTAISNFLAGQVKLSSNATFAPTIGVRILEFDVKLAQDTVNVELWDASGDHSFEGCWKAIMHEADGVILVYNPDAPAQDQQIGDWFEFFVRKNGLRDEQCMVFAHRQNLNNNEKFRAPPLFQRVHSSLTNPRSENEIKAMFDNFINEVSNIKRRNADQSADRK